VPKPPRKSTCGTRDSTTSFRTFIAAVWHLTRIVLVPQLRWTTTLDPAIVPEFRAMVTTVTAADAATATDDT